MTFRERVEHELACARIDHKPLGSLHEGLAVIQEEVFELQGEVYKKRADRTPLLILGELVQVAAAAQRLAEDLSLCPR